MNKPDCIFCKIVSGEIPAEKVYEDENFLAFLDITPVNLGHTLLVPKEHCRNIFDMKDDILSSIGLVIKKISTAIKNGLKADGVNIGMNNEPSAGQVVFHAHIHIMPRFQNDGYELWHGGKYENADKMKEVSNKIKSSF